MNLSRWDQIALMSIGWMLGRENPTVFVYDQAWGGFLEAWERNAKGDFWVRRHRRKIELARGYVVKLDDPQQIRGMVGDIMAIRTLSMPWEMEEELRHHMAVVVPV